MTNPKRPVAVAGVILAMTFAALILIGLWVYFVLAAIARDDWFIVVTPAAPTVIVALLALGLWKESKQ